jgi:hypothetical protein
MASDGEIADLTRRLDEVHIPANAAWEEAEAEIALLREREGGLPTLIDVLEAVNGHRDPEATGAEGSDSDGADVRATGEPQPWDSERPVLAKMPVLVANLRRCYHSQVSVTRDHINTRMRRHFENYHALGSALSHRRRMIQIRCSQHNRYQPYDGWTTFFWQKWDDLNREVILYRNKLDSADTSRISRYHMQNALFEFLVFLFLTRVHRNKDQWRQR